MELKCEKKVVIKVEYSDLEKYIKSLYGYELCIQADQETGNDESLDFDVTKEEIIGYDAVDVEKFKTTGKYNFFLGTLLTHMCNEGQLEEGNYIINVSF